LSLSASYSEESDGEDGDDHHDGGLDVCTEGLSGGSSLGSAGGDGDSGNVAYSPSKSISVGGVEEVGSDTIGAELS
jgi:hypothetical protein